MLLLIVCVLYFLYFPVFLEKKNENTMLSILSFEILNQWSFQKNWYEHYIIIHGHAMFQKLVMEKQQWFNMMCFFLVQAEWHS